MATGLLNDGINVLDEFSALAPNPADYEPGDPAVTEKDQPPADQAPAGDEPVVEGDAPTVEPAATDEPVVVDEPVADEAPVTAASASIDPAEHTIPAINEHLSKHPEELDAVLAAEKAGRSRKTLVSDLEGRVAQRDTGDTTEQPAGAGAEAAPTKES